MTLFLATYAGVCANCGEPFPAGEPITIRDGETTHATPCEAPVETSRPVCGECFTEVAVNGHCMCVG